MSATKFGPIGPRVLVRICEIKRKSEGGIILSAEEEATAENSLTEGLLVKVGPLAWHDYKGEPWATVGDTVQFVRYAGKRFEENGFLWCVLNDEDLIMKKEISDE